MCISIFRLAICVLLFEGAALLHAQSFNLQSTPADLARWMYPFNASPTSRPSASTFAAFGSAPDFDTRSGQYLLGWNTSNSIPMGVGASNYLLRHVRVTLTISRDMAYVYSDILRDYRTYFPTNDSRYIPSANANSPVELFGAGFRGGYTAATFQQGTTFFAIPNGSDYNNRTAFAVGFNTNGVLVDVSNNVGDDGTNEISSPFEVAPFAVGTATNVASGQLMPAGSQLTFALNLDDPLIYGYLQQSLNDGRLMLVASSLINSSFGGSPNYPDFYTIFSPLADADEFPLIDVEGAVIRTSVDGDGDGLPDDWEQFYFGSTVTGAADDPDGDGVSNLAEFQAGTNPTAVNNVLRLLSVRHDQNGTEIQFSFAPNRQYQIQWSSDLLQWQTEVNPVLSYTSDWLSKTVSNPTYPSPIFAVWRDTSAGGEKRFYRVSAH